MTAKGLESLGAALRNDPQFASVVAKAQSADEVVAVAAGLGIDVTSSEIAGLLSPAPGELSDAELATASGGYTFPATDWIYCDNPWTNVWCTLKC